MSGNGTIGQDIREDRDVQLPQETDPLLDALRRSGKGSVAIANTAARHRAEVSPGGTKDHPISHDRVSAFLRGKAISKRSRRILENVLPFLGVGLEASTAIPVDTEVAVAPSAGLFAALIDFLQVPERRLHQCRVDIAGTYTFHAHSEDREHYSRHWLVRGALCFYHDAASNELRVRELQRSLDDPIEADDPGEHPDLDTASDARSVHTARPKPKMETWDGYYLLRQGKVIVILRNYENIPKFYILDAVPYGEQNPEKVTEMWGVMVKAGKGRLFTSQVKLTRSARAFATADLVLADEVVPRSTVEAITQIPLWLRHYSHPR